MPTTAALATLWRTIERLGFTLKKRYTPTSNAGLMSRRPVDDTPCRHWQTHTVVAALRLDGLGVPAVFEGPIDNPTFLAYIEQVLVPTLHPG